MSQYSFNYFWQYEPQIFRFWQSLTQAQKTALKNQLQNIQIDLFQQQRQCLQKSDASIAHLWDPFDGFSFSGSLNHQFLGQQMIEQGRLGCLLLAGGQGTRLQYGKPKGTYPISVIKKKSLFQLCLEKVKAAGKKAGKALNLAIMTSPENDEETRSFFHNHDYFGCHPDQISFFSQDSLPLLDFQGHLFLKTPWQVATGANGNGSSLISFAKSGILNQWIQQGVEYLHMIPIDNPLADPFDAELLGFHRQQDVDITVKCIKRSIPDENLGLLVKQNDHCTVIEYSEMPDQERKQRLSDGNLKHSCANLSLFCFSLSFIQRMASTNQFLPLHKAWKSAQYTDKEGKSRFSSRPIAWKFETFIFDWLSHTKKVAVLIYPREQCFAPLKNARGIDSPRTVREALQNADKKVIQSITGLPPPHFPFELTASFYYPTPDLLSQWKGKSITEPYTCFSLE